MNSATCVFGGQSTQADNMCLDLINHPETQKVLDCAKSIIGEDCEWLVTDALAEDLKQTYNCQRALYLSQIIHYYVYCKENPDFETTGVLGHSVGIVAALTVAGCLTLEEGLWFIKNRAEAFDKVCRTQNTPSGLSVVKAEKTLLEQAIEIIHSYEGISLALHNTVDLITIGGSVENLLGFQEYHDENKDEGDWPIIKCGSPLDVEAAFHTNIFDDAQKQLENLLKDIKIKQPKIGLYMGTSGKKESDPEEIKRNLALQATHPEWHTRAVWSSFHDHQKNYLEISHRPQPIKWFKKILVDNNFKTMKREFKATSLTTQDLL